MVGEGVRAGQKKAAPFDSPPCASWSYCHVVLSCSLNNTTSQHVTFRIVEKALLFWCVCSGEALCCPKAHPSTSCHLGQAPLDRPCCPCLPTSLPGILAQVGGGVLGGGGEQGESKAQGHVTVGERAPGELGVSHTAHLSHSTPHPSLLYRDSGPSGLASLCKEPLCSCSPCL